MKPINFSILKDSKLRDRNGKPKIYYHATFEKYDFKDIKANSDGHFGKGIYFGYSLDYVEHYGNRVLKCYLNIKNPIEYYDQGAFEEKFIPLLIKKGVKFDMKLYNEKWKDNDDYDPEYVLDDCIVDCKENGKIPLLVNSSTALFSLLAKELGYDGIDEIEEVVAFDKSQIVPIEELDISRVFEVYSKKKGSDKINVCCEKNNPITFHFIKDAKEYIKKNRNKNENFYIREKIVNENEKGDGLITKYITVYDDNKSLKKHKELSL